MFKAMSTATHRTAGFPVADQSTVANVLVASLAPVLRALAASLVLLVLGLFNPVLAQAADPADADGREEPVPPPPAFSASQLLLLDMPRFMSLSFGIDPASISISPAKTVRYVVVATSPSGASNVMYEGLRCVTGEFITYGRQYTDGKWNMVAAPVWRPLTDINTARHALAFARQGACDGRNATADSVAVIVRNLKTR